jgi:hypothetical protein
MALLKPHTDNFMMHARRTSPRAEYRLIQSQRVSESLPIAKRFPQLKSLTVNVTYFDAEDGVRNSELKYKVNVEHGKSLFYFACPAGECVGGDFDLSDALAEAVKKRRKIASGEMRCQGWSK